MLIFDKKFPVKYFYYFIALLPFIDILNGIFLNYLKISITPGEILRPIFLIYFTIYLLRNDIKKFKVLLLFALFIIISIIYHNISGYFYVSDLSYHAKLSYNFVFFLFFYSLLQHKVIILSEIYKSLILSVGLILASLSISLLTNTTMSSYSDSNSYLIGVKGYFESLNALSAVLAIMLPIIIANFFEKNISNKLVFTIYFFTSVFLVLLGTKTGIFACILTPIVLVVFILIKSKFKSKTGFIIIFTSLISLFISYSIFGSVIESIINRQMYFFSRNDLISYFLSQRNTGLQVVVENLKTNFNIFDFLFGFGLINGKNFINDHGGVTIEMDLIDIFHYSGFIIVLIFIMLFFTALFFAVKNFFKENTIYNFSLLMSYSYAIIISTLGGHVLTDAFSGIYMSIVAVIILNNSENDLNHRLKIY